MVLATEISHPEHFFSSPHTRTQRAYSGAVVEIFAVVSTRKIIVRFSSSAAVFAVPSIRHVLFLFFLLLLALMKFLTSGKGFFTTSFAPFFHRNGFTLELASAGTKN